MSLVRVKSVIIGSSLASVVEGVVIGMGGVLLFSLLHLVVTDGWIPFDLRVISMIFLAAVMARYRYGLVPIWVALFPPLVIIMEASCTTTGLAITTGCNAVGRAILGSVLTGTLGYVFGRVFAWKRQTNSSAKTFSAISKGFLACGLPLYVIGMLIPQYGVLWIGFVRIQWYVWQELLVRGGKGAIGVGILCFVVGRLLEWRIDNRSAAT